MKRNTLVNLLLGLGLVLALGAGIVSSSNQALAQDAVVQGEMSVQAAVGTAFTYQGRLTDLAGPVSGNCDFRFKLWTAATGGQQAGVTVEKTNVALANGNFTVELDFGSGVFGGPDTFSGDARWLSVDVRCPAGSGSYTALSGRVPLNPAPYALSLRPGAQIAGDLNSANGLTVRNTTTGDFGTGVKAETSAARGTALHAVATSQSLETTYGVYATTASRGGVAVYGESTEGGDDLSNTAYGGYFKTIGWGDTGVYAESSWARGDGVGVHGVSRANMGYGGYFESDQNVGLYASGSDADIELGGEDGKIVATGRNDANMTLVSNDNVYVYLDDNDDQGTISSFNILDGSDRLTPVFEVEGGGTTHVYGDLQVTGTKNNVVNTETHGQRLLYAMESPENWFEDFGSARLTAGEATVTIEPMFAETVNLNEEYHVFLTPLGDCALYVAEKTPTSFTVRAMGGRQCGIAFDYRLVAKRLGYEHVRLEEAK